MKTPKAKRAGAIGAVLLPVIMLLFLAVASRYTEAVMAGLLLAGFFSFFGWLGYCIGRNLYEDNHS